MRKPDWFPSLCGVILDRRQRRFEHGSHDCGLFAAACIDAMTGTRYESTLTPLYSNARGMTQMLREQGGLEGAIEAALGFSSSSRIRTGDCVLFRQKTGALTCGIAFGPLLVAPAPRGLSFTWRRRVVRHWAI